MFEYCVYIICVFNVCVYIMSVYFTFLVTVDLIRTEILAVIKIIASQTGADTASVTAAELLLHTASRGRLCGTHIHTVQHTTTVQLWPIPHTHYTHHSRARHWSHGSRLRRHTAYRAADTHAHSCSGTVGWGGTGTFLRGDRSTVK